AQRVLAFGEQPRLRFELKVAALFIVEEELLLDAKAETWFADGHRPMVPRLCKSAVAGLIRPALATRRRRHRRRGPRSSRWQKSPYPLATRASATNGCAASR